MFDQVLESFRKASESSLQAQQHLLEQWLQGFPAAPVGINGPSLASTVELQKRFRELATETLNKNRELLELAFKSAVRVVEQTSRISEAKSTKDYESRVEELWRELADTLKAQSDTLISALSSATNKLFELPTKTQGAQ